MSAILFWLAKPVAFILAGMVFVLIDVAMINRKERGRRK